MRHGEQHLEQLDNRQAHGLRFHVVDIGCQLGAFAYARLAMIQKDAEDITADALPGAQVILVAATGKPTVRWTAQHILADQPAERRRSSRASKI